MLAVYALYAQISALQDDLEQELGTGFVLKHLIHKIIIQQTKTAQALQIFHGQRLPCTLFVQLQGLDFAHRVLLDLLLGVQPTEERA